MKADHIQDAANRSITVAVSGANGNLGKILLECLKEKNIQVVALVRSPVELPANKVISNWMTSPEAVRAMQEADVVIHLTGKLMAKNAEFGLKLTSLHTLWQAT